MDLLNKFVGVNRSIAESSLEGEAVDLRMVGKNNPSSVPMLHFDMASLAVDFNETHALKSG
jgi:hypothetical protein